jgi:hypothetical protein
MPDTSKESASDDIYHLYALLMAEAQLAESAIGLFVSVADLVSSPAYPHVSLEELLAETRRKTLGQLCSSLVRTLRELAPNDPPPDALAGLFAELLDARNWLAHRYFLDRSILRRDSAHHALLVEELILMTKHFSGSLAILRAAWDRFQAGWSQNPAMKDFDFSAFVRQRLFREYGDLQASLRRLRAAPPFGLSTMLFGHEPKNL